MQAVEIETGPNPQVTVIWLHGLGADGHDFAPIVPELVRREAPPHTGGAGDVPQLSAGGGGRPGPVVSASCR